MKKKKLETLTCDLNPPLRRRARVAVLREAAREMLERFPKTPSRTLARMMLKEHPEWRATPLERARSEIRLLRGTHGARQKRLTKLVPEAVRTPQESEAARRAGGWPVVKLPGTSARPWRRWVLPAGFSRVAVFGDVHLPYHDRAAVERAVREAKERRAQVVLLNGDFVDAHAVSHWERDPRRRRFPQELKLARKFLDYMVQEIRPELVVWKLGNHEERYWRYLAGRAPELVGLEQFEPRAVYGSVFADTGRSEIVADKRVIYLGKLPVIHGHEYVKAVLSPVNPARGYFLRAKGSVLGSHFHQVSKHVETRISGRVVGAWSTGCLCDLHPDYAPLNRWTHGAALVEVDAGGAFKVTLDEYFE